MLFNSLFKFYAPLLAKKLFFIEVLFKQITSQSVFVYFSLKGIGSFDCLFKQKIVFKNKQYPTQTPRIILIITDIPQPIIAGIKIPISVVNDNKEPPLLKIALKGLLCLNR